MTTEVSNEPASQSTADAPASPPAPKRPLARQVIFGVLALGILGFGGWWGYDWWVNGRFLISTDDAYVTADITTVSPNVSAYVKAVAVKANQPVKAGDVLVVLDDGDYRLALTAAEAKIGTQKATIARIGEQVLAAEAAVAGARAQIEAARADLAAAEINYNRQLALTANNASAQANLDNAVTTRERARALVTAADVGLDSASANVAVVRAQRDEAIAGLAELENTRAVAERNLGYTVIRAPIEGVAGNLAVEVGDYVTPAKALGALVPLGAVRIDANFKETQVENIRPGNKVRFTLDAYPDREFTGVVEGLSPASGAVFSLLPPQNATGNFTKVVQRLPVRITLTPETLAEGIVRPGMSAVVSVDSRATASGQN